MAQVTLKQLLEAGVHFGHQTSRWNPKMKPYIFTARNGIHIIDLQKTVRLLDDAWDFVRNVAASGRPVLFVGTKKQAQETIQTEAARCGMYFVNRRWMGGMLTNFSTVKKRIERLQDLRKMQQEGQFEQMPKKEAKRLQELAILDLGQDLAPGRGLLASLLAGVGDLPGEQLDGADRVVVARDDVRDQVGIAVRVGDRDHRDLQAIGLGHRDVLLARVDHVERARQPLHVGDAVEVEHQPVELVLEALRLLLRHRLELSLLLQAAQLLQPLDALLDGAEVGQHAAHPAAVDEVHAAARGLGLDGLLRLLLGADEQHRPAARGDAAHEVPRVIQQPHRLLQVDDVDAVARGEDVGPHLRVPPAGLVPEVDARLQQLFQGYLSHVRLPPRFTSARFWPR